MTNLISMTDFVLDKSKSGKGTVASVLNSIFKYAKFLKQPLELWMFIPCAEVGNVLEEPYNDGNYDQYYLASLNEYQQAKELCLFEGIPFEEAIYILAQTENKTIEDLARFNIILTQTAIKNLGL